MQGMSDDHLLDALLKLTGRAEASFRPDQMEVVEALFDERERMPRAIRAGFDQRVRCAQPVSGWVGE